MSKIFFIITVVIFLSAIGFVGDGFAQENPEPPLLGQPVQSQTLKNQPAVVGPPPPEPGLLSPALGTPLPAQGLPSPTPGSPPPSPPQGTLNSIGNPPIPIQTLQPKILFTNLPRAIATVEQLNRLLQPGKVWIMQAPAGEIDVKAGILYQGAVVAVLHFSQDGSVLPLGLNNHTYQNNVDIQRIKNNLVGIVRNIKILPAAEFLEPEGCWVFPLVYNEIIIAKLKVYRDGIHVVQDYIANQEMVYIGQ